VPLFAFDAGYDPIALKRWPSQIAPQYWYGSARTGCSMPTLSPPNLVRWAGLAVMVTGFPAPMRTAGLLLTPS
jgi:hypothetical protein